MGAGFWIIAQTILTEPEHQGIALGAIIVGVIAGILIALSILVPPALMLWKKFKPAIQELGKSINAIASAPAAPEPHAIGQATRDAIAPLIDTVRDLVSENKTLRETAEDRATMNQGLVDRLARLEQQAEKNRVELQKQIDAQCLLIENQEQKITTLQQALTSKDTEIEAKNRLIAELTTKVQRYDELEVRVAKLENEVKALTMDKAELERLLAEAQQAHATEKARAEKLTEQLARADEEIKTLKRALEDERARLATPPASARADDPSSEAGIFPDDPVGGRDDAAVGA